MKVLILSVTPITTRHKKAKTIAGDELQPMGINPQIELTVMGEPSQGEEREDKNEKERNPQPRKARRLSNARLTFLKGNELIS